VPVLRLRLGQVRARRRDANRLGVAAECSGSRSRGRHDATGDRESASSLGSRNEGSNAMKKWTYISLAVVALLVLACGGWIVKSVRPAAAV
jgi:hypothetical protein